MKHYYQLASGGVYQIRYQLLIDRLDEAGVTAQRNQKVRVTRHRPNIEPLKTLILALLDKGGSYSGRGIHDQFQHDWSRISIEDAIRSLRQDGLISLNDQKRYCTIEPLPEDLEIGMPILYLPHSRRAQQGTIVEFKELKQGRGGIYPIAQLATNQQLFISPDVAAIDKAAIAQADHEHRVIGWIERAGETGITHGELCRVAYYEGVPHLGEMVKRLLKAGKIRRKVNPRTTDSSRYFLGDCHV